jgi:hypothetical protein
VAASFLENGALSVQLSVDLSKGRERPEMADSWYGKGKLFPVERS